MKRRNQYGAIVGVVAFVMMAVLVAAVVWQRQFLRDQLRVWQYTPSPEIARIADDAGMNQKGKFYYYASHPSLDGSQHFNDECRRKEAGSAILGCYKAGRIYLYHVKDERLRGVVEVTAAHEMLHAVYERLSDAEKKQLEGLLANEEKKISDHEFAERMAYYRRAQPGEHYNELHSIIGTEFASISPELESHYSRYFYDRKKVVGLHERYSGTFNELKQGSAMLRGEVQDIADRIEKGSSEYNAEVAQINADIERFNARARQGEFSSQAEFAAARTQLLQRLQQAEAKRQSINRLVQEHEQKRTQHNHLVDESNNLQKALDSSLAPSPSL